MNVARQLNYRFAAEVLASEQFNAERDELFSALGDLPVSESPIPSVKRTRFNPINQTAMNSWLDARLRPLGWEVHPVLVEGSGLAADYRKGRVQVEVQFGNMARWYADVFKFQVSYTQRDIDVAVLVVPTRRVGRLVGENIADFERISNELPRALMSITLPILVVGLEMDDEPYRVLEARQKEWSTGRVRTEPPASVDEIDLEGEDPPDRSADA